MLPKILAHAVAKVDGLVTVEEPNVFREQNIFYSCWSLQIDGHTFFCENFYDSSVVV